VVLELCPFFKIRMYRYVESFVPQILLTQFSSHLNDF